MAESREAAGREPQPGQRVRQFEILSEVGRGGMGILFRARDHTLGRVVALKCPLPSLVGDQKQRQRFLREARAAAILSHSNIVAVLDAFEEDGIPWIVEPFVEGQSLRTLLLSTRRLELPAILRFAEGIAAALEAAHSKHILHRDVKPSNILVSTDDQILLTDFGLARSLRPASVQLDRTGDLADLTTEGAVVGTLNYMSPEQILGRELDGRSDVFSLGVVLYEMCTGVSPFAGSNFGETLDRIMHREPEPISRLNYEVPSELERIVRKAMVKKVEFRYQTARDLLTDLRALRAQIETGSYREPVHVAGPDSATLRVLNKVSRRNPVLILSGIATVLIALGFSTALYLTTRGPAEEPVAPPAYGSPIQVTTSEAWERTPALSPDGSRVAYVSSAAGSADIWVSDARGGQSIRITEDPAAEVEPAWHPDGSHVYFASDRGGEWGIWKAAQFGGSPLLVVPGGTDPAISPDGRRIAFARADADGNLRIAAAPLDRPGEAVFITEPDDGLWNHESPAWSPDGKRICYASHETLWIVPAERAGNEEKARPLTRDGVIDRRPTWSADGAYVYFSSFREGTVAIWRVRVEDGALERVTLGTGEEDAPSFSRDGSRLAYATKEARYDIVVRDRTSGRESVLTGLGYGLMPAFFPDNSALVYASDRWGADMDLWMQPLADGAPHGEPQRLTEGPGHFSHPVVSPDGRWIAVYRILEGKRSIWALPSGGGIPSRITEGTSPDVHPAWSPDGRSLCFASDREGRTTLWVIPVAEGRPAGEPVRITSGKMTASAPAWSPDGRLIAFLREDQDSSEAAVVDPATGETSVVTRGAGAIRIRWDASGALLLVSGFWGSHRVTLRAVSPEDGSTTPVLPEVLFGEDAVEAYFDVSRDGRLLAWCRQEFSGDIWTLAAR